MSTIKSTAVWYWDMFYIRHNSDNFTVIDCSIYPTNEREIIEDIKTASKWKWIHRFISTHPDEDHIHWLEKLDDAIWINNFYTIKNSATKSTETESFKRYVKLRDDPKKAFYLFKGCSRKWMNIGCDERGSSWINILRPILENEHYKEALKIAEDGWSPNNISSIISYSLEWWWKFLRMWDLETDFIEAIKDDLNLSKVNVLFAPHHWRDSWTLPKDILDILSPDIIIIWEAPSEHINYDYSWYNTITQNTAKDIKFECLEGRIDIYTSNIDYKVNFLDKDSTISDNEYLWTLYIP